MASDNKALPPDVPPDAVTHAAGPLSTPAFTPDSIPSVIANFQVRRLIGAGGMGAVYEAEQTMPRRTVALKVIRPGFVTPELRRRFEMEVQVLGRLQHPGIAQIFSAGVTDIGWGPQPYFAMELVVGLSIADYATERRLDARERLRLVGSVCDAVEHAHRRGIIHRDLKPGNIIVDAASGQPKILDFGVARATDPDLNFTSHTQMGQLVGTLPYMSPEQLAADPNEIDTRSDVYAVGVILYELLTGQLPHDTTHASTLQVMTAIRDRDPARVGTFDRRLRGDVETIVAKALEKEKERRYGSAAELAADIRRYLNDEPILARPPSGVYQLRKFARRNRTLVAGVAGAFLILIAGVVASTWQAVRATRAERLAGTRLVEANEARAVAQARERDAIEAQGLADDRRVEAEANFRLAEEARAEAERQGEANRELLYVSDMNLAMRMWGEGDHPRVVELLGRHQPAPGLADLRGFEWFHLWHASHLYERMFELPGFVQAMDVTSDGGLVAAGGAGGDVRIWDAASGRVRLELDAREPVSAIALSSDGQRLAVGSRTGTIRVVDAETTRELATFTMSEVPSRVSNLRFASAGRVLIASSGTSKVWDVETSRELFSHPGAARALPGEDDASLIITRGPGDVRIWSPSGERPLATEDRVRDVVPSDDGEHVAILVANGLVSVWDRSGGFLRSFRPDRPIEGPIVLSSGGRLIAGRVRSDLVVWNTETGRAVATVAVQPGLQRYAFSPRATLMLAYDNSGLKVIDIAAARVRAVVRGHAGTLSRAVVSTDERRLVTAGSDSVKVWDIGRISEVERLEGHRGQVAAIAASSDGRYVASVGEDPLPAGSAPQSTVILWDLRAGAQAASRRVESAATAVTVAGLRTLVVGDAAGRLTFWDSARETEPVTVAAHDQLVRWVGRSADGVRVVSAGGNAVKVWETSGRLVTTLEHPSARTAAFAPDGRRLATAGFDGLVRIWTLGSRAEPRVFGGHGQGVWSVAWSPDGQLIASSDETGGVVIWDVASGHASVRLRAHPTRATTVGFSPDGQRLLSGGLDGVVRLWDRRTWSEVAHFQEGVRGISGAVFTPDGKAIAAATDQRPILVWRATDKSAVRP